MKLNLGCGFLKIDGYVNIDYEELCAPDLCINLEDPWPFDDNSVSEIRAHHTLEHLGATYEKFLFVLKEMYRVSQHQATWHIRVPHWQHDNFYHDPTHVRVITPQTLRMYDQTRNMHDFETGGHESKLGLFSNIDIELVKHQYIANEPWNTQLANGTLHEEDMQSIGQNYINACQEIHMEVLVHKPQRHANWIEQQLALRKELQT